MPNKLDNSIASCSKIKHAHEVWKELVASLRELTLENGDEADRARRAVTGVMILFMEDRAPALAQLSGLVDLYVNAKPGQAIAETAPLCPFCKHPPEIKTIRCGDPQFGDEYGIGCFNRECSVKPYADGYSSPIEAIRGWSEAPEGELREVYSLENKATALLDAFVKSPAPASKDAGVLLCLLMQLFYDEDRLSLLKGAEFLTPFVTGNNWPEVIGDKDGPTGN